MSSIGVFFNDPGFEAYPFNEADYRASYRELGLALLGKGSSLIVLRDKATYVGGNRFTGGWEFTGQEYVRINEPVTVDVIYNKGSELQADEAANIVNRPEFDAICRDKMQTFKLFQEYFPGTVLAHTKEEGLSALETMRTANVVLKPVDGWGGKKVWIGPKADAPEYFEPYPVMVQELIDTSAGIPGVVPGKHDFRLILANDRVILSYARMPADGKFVSNVSQGGTVRHVPADKRPIGALRLAEKIGAAFTDYGNRIYSIDCGLDSDGTWKIIELNDQPGLSPRSDCGDEADAYYESLAAFLTDSAKTR